MARRLSPRRIKLHRAYTYEQAADLLGVVPETVRSWRSAGLDVLVAQKPHLILGSVLKPFLERRAASKRRTLATDQFLCLSCGEPRRAYGGMVDYVALTPSRGMLRTLCEVCETPCGKFVSRAKPAELTPKLAVVMRGAE